MTGDDQNDDHWSLRKIVLAVFIFLIFVAALFGFVATFDRTVEDSGLAAKIVPYYSDVEETQKDLLNARNEYADHPYDPIARERLVDHVNYCLHAIENYNEIIVNYSDEDISRASLPKYIDPEITCKAPSTGLQLPTL